MPRVHILCLHEVTQHFRVGLMAYNFNLTDYVYRKLHRKFKKIKKKSLFNLFNAVHPDVLFDSQGIRSIQCNTSFLLLKYTYIQSYMFQLYTAIIRPLP